MLAEKGIAWEKSADVVIIGNGLAGIAAAITAQEAGAETLILEKQPAEGFYTSSSLAAGIFTASSDLQGTIKYIEALNRVNNSLYWTDPDILRVWAEYTVDNKNWIEKMGVHVRLLAHGGGEHPELPGCGSVELYQSRGFGYRMMNVLYEQLAARNIPVMYNAAAKRLITNLRGEIIGVKIEHTEGDRKQEINIKANKAVILACGGFEYNEEMKLQYLKIYPTYFYCTPANTGDGVKMALDVGADLWHMNCVSGRMLAKFPEYPWAFAMHFGGQGWNARIMQHEATHEAVGYIVVDRSGRRFTSENVKLHCMYYELALFDSQKLEYPRIPSYWIFDQARMDAGPLCGIWSGPAGPHRLYTWSKDNSQELERGWITSGRTVRELADKLGLPADNLDKTVANYNRYCEKGQDPEFGRKGLASLDHPPFYAVTLWPGGPNTEGGPRRNRKSQIVNTDGDPIPGLYGGGELGSVNGMLLLNGGNLGECIALGRLAGENAAREKTRKA